MNPNDPEQILASQDSDVFRVDSQEEELQSWDLDEFEDLHAWMGEEPCQ